MARQRLELMAQIKLLDLTDDVKALTKDILRSSVLPADADRDAGYIALPTVHEMDMLHVKLPAHRQRLHSGQTAEVS